MVRFPLKEVQSTRTQRPTSGSSYPYVEIMIGDLLNQRITQLQLEQVRACECVCVCLTELTMSRRLRVCTVWCLLTADLGVFCRAWSCVESLPCTWKTCCQSEKRDSPCHRVKSPFYSKNI